VAKFKYDAVGEDGTPVRGVVKAGTKGEARNILLSKKIESANLEDVKSRLNVELSAQRVPRVELMHFSRQLAAFVRAGIPILEAISTQEEGTGNREFRRVLAEVHEDLRGGATFVTSIGKHPRVFPAFYIGMVESAELTGRLDDVLDRLAHYIERDLEAKRKIRSALAYPLIVVGMSAVTVGVLTVFVLPRFKTFFESLNAKLPLPTRMLLAFTGFMSTWWFIFVGLFVIAVLAVIAARRSEGGRERIDAFLLKLPVVGETVRFAVVERFCRSLAVMVQAGVPLPEAMVVATDGANNAVYKRALGTAREEMIRGEGIARPIARTNLFPISASQMMKVGEETGSLDDQLGVAADFFEQELDYKIQKLTSLFEPAVIIGAGLIVGFVAIALVSAMYGIFHQTGKL
jgi:type IV pilus assembly protein PilC